MALCTTVSLRLCLLRFPPESSVWLTWTICAVADVLLMHQGESAHEATGNYCSSGSFEFDSVADGGAPIVYDKTVLAGDDGKHNSFVYFAATEIETWQL